MAGWVKIYRHLMEMEFYKAKPFSKGQAWIDLLLLAAYEPKTVYIRGNMVEVKRGQIAMSLQNLADRWGWSKNKADRFLDYLSDCETAIKIEHFRGNVINLITILNYDKYQGDGATEGATDVRQNGQQNGSTNKEIEELKNYNIISSQNAPAYAHTREDGPPSQTLPPRENWRYLSSVRKASLGFDADAIADYKRRLIAEELSEVASDLGMSHDACEKFLRKWCEHSPGDEKIRAEFEPVFSVRDRAESFMQWYNRNQPASGGLDADIRRNPNLLWKE